MIGGARYSGTSPNDAGEILDKSQDQYAHDYPKPGHPRGHAPPNVETYSMKLTKSAFLTRDDQNLVAHLALSSNKVQVAMMARLNRGEKEAVIEVMPGEMRCSRTLPKGIMYYMGKSYGGEKNIRSVTLVLRHHRGQFNNPDADVFVHTFYPILEHPRTRRETYGD